MNLVKIVRAQYGGLPVAATHSLALRRQMLEHHGHSPAADLAAMLTLHTGNDGLAHAGAISGSSPKHSSQRPQRGSRAMSKPDTNAI